MDRTRRDLLRATGAAAAASTVGIGGCLETVGLGGEETDGDDPDDDERDLDWGDGEYPAYASWIPAPDGATMVTYVEWATLEDLESFEDGPGRDAEAGSGDGEETTNDLVEAEDALLSTPASGALYGTQVLVSGTWMGSTLGRIVDETGDDLARENLETSLEELLVVDGSVVCLGDVATDELEALLTEPRYSYGTEFERTDGRGEYDLYEPVDAAGRPDEAIAVGPDAVAFANGGDDPSGEIGRLLEARTGDGERATETVERFGWLLETAGDGDVVFAAYGGAAAEPAEDEGDLGDVDGFVSSLSFAAAGGADAAFAAVYEDIDDDDESDIEGDFGETAADLEFEMTERRLAASATWDDLAAAIGSERD